MQSRTVETAQDAAVADALAMLAGVLTEAQARGIALAVHSELAQAPDGSLVPVAVIAWVVAPMSDARVTRHLLGCVDEGPGEPIIVTPAKPVAAVLDAMRAELAQLVEEARR